MSTEEFWHGRADPGKLLNVLLVLILFLLPGLVTPIPAGGAPAGGVPVARETAGMSQSVPVRRTKAPATLALTQSTDARGRIRLVATSNAKNVIVIYRTAGGQNRRVSARIRHGVARVLISAGATGILAQTTANSRLTSSAVVVATPARLPVPAPRRASPGPVSQARITAQGETTISAAWVNPRSRDLQAVLVYRSASAPSPSQPWDRVTVLPGTATSFVDTGLTPNTGYTYGIFTLDRDLNVGSGISLGAATLPVPTPPPPTPTPTPPTPTATPTPSDTTPPSPVRSVIIAAVTRNSVELVWSDPVPVGDLHRIAIRRTAGPRPPATVAEGTLVYEQLWTVSHGFTDTGLAPGNQYSYSVFALDQAGHASPPVSVTTTTTAWVAIAVGPGRACALDNGGAAWCWGSAYLGDGTSNASLKPVRVSGGHVFSALVVGVAHTCGLDTNGAAWCWGRNAQGLLGAGSGVPDQPSPVAVAGGHTFTVLAAGVWHTCGLDRAGAAWCWGENIGAGQLGDGTFTDRNSPVAVIGEHVFTTITAGFDTSCGIDKTGATWCWGIEYRPQGGTYRHSVPFVVAAGQTFTSLVSELAAKCGVEATGKAWCWGPNSFGEVGDGTLTPQPNPVAVAGAHTFTALSMSWSHTCGLDTSGAGWCWGNNGYGQLGDGTNMDSSTPVAVTGGHVFTSLSVDRSSSCGVDTNGTAWCWGENTVGQLGDRTTVNRSTPVAVMDSVG